MLLGPFDDETEIFILAPFGWADKPAKKHC
jgi:hypothetical protein